MTTNCERWSVIVDRIAVGEAVSTEEAEFEAQHRFTCALCRAEAAIWKELGECLGDQNAPPASVLKPGAPGDAPRVQWEPSGQRTRRARRIMGLTAGAVASIAALVVLWLGWAADEAKPPRELGTSPVSVVLVSGDVSVGGTHPSAGASLGANDVLQVSRGRACLSYAPGTTACLGDDTKLRLTSNGPADKGLWLDTGRVVCRLDRHTSNARFRVATPLGTITAKGTVFAVEHLPGGRVSVRLHRGAVEVRATDGATRELKAPAAMILQRGAEAPKKVASRGSRWQADLPLMETARLWAEDAVTPLDISPSAPGARVFLDGAELGEAPLTMLVGRGSHSLEIRRPGYEAHRETLSIVAAERVTRTPVLTPVAKGRASAEPVEDPSTQPSASTASTPPAALLRRAQDLRRRGSTARAAAVYRELVQRHPNSGEASAGLLSLAELQLSQLNAPAQALESFERYLARGGSLRQEASYGRIRALRRLGRTGAVRDAEARFLKEYPRSPQAESLRRSAEGR